MRTLLTPLILALAALGAAGAQGPDESPDALFIEGRFIEAAQAAEGEAGSADAQALAAKAYAAAALFADDPAQSDGWGEAARARAEAAIALDPDHVEGQLQLAVALWLQSRRLGGFEAFRDGMPQRGLALIEAARADAPDDPRALAMLGAWHFEALRRGGQLARSVLHADLSTAEEAFARAEALGPHDAAIPAQLGLAYLSIGRRRFRDEAERALERALSLTPRDAFEAAFQERARQARRLLDEREYAELDAALERWFSD